MVVNLRKVIYTQLKPGKYHCWKIYLPVNEAASVRTSVYTIISEDVICVQQVAFNL